MDGYKNFIWIQMKQTEQIHWKFELNQSKLKEIQQIAWKIETNFF